MERVLIIGGTGMLGGVVENLVKKGDKVTVLARSCEKYNRMLDQFKISEEKVTFISADYFDTDALMQVLNEHINRNGPFDKAVIWMRSSAKESLNTLVDVLGSQGNAVKVFRVHGSAASQGILPISTSESLSMHQIILGFKIENGEDSRWLTNEEISKGVTHALEAEIPLLTVGITQPWEQRPTC